MGSCVSACHFTCTGQGGALAQGFVILIARWALRQGNNGDGELDCIFVRCYTNQLVQSALGYFLYPLMSIGLGVVVLGERLGRRGLALFCATAGVGLKATLLDGFPFVALLWVALLSMRDSQTPGYGSLSGDGDRIADDRHWLWR